jgi:hypothetical protein
VNNLVPKFDGSSASFQDSVREVLQNLGWVGGHGKVVMFEVTNPVEGRCHDQVEVSAVWRGYEGASFV